MQAMFTGSGPRMLMISPQPIEGGEAALAEGLAAARAAAPGDARGRAAGQLRRSAAARAARPRGLAPADRGHGRHHRPLRQRLHPDLQAHRVRARLGPGAAALRRRHFGDSRPTSPTSSWLGRAGRAFGPRRARSRGDGAAADRAAHRPVLPGRRGRLRPRRTDQRRRSHRPAAPARHQAYPSALGPGSVRALPHRRGRELRPQLLLGLGAGRTRAGRRDPAQRPALAADRARAR